MREPHRAGWQRPLSLVVLGVSFLGSLGLLYLAVRFLWLTVADQAVYKWHGAAGTPWWGWILVAACCVAFAAGRVFTGIRIRRTPDVSTHPVHPVHRRAVRFALPAFLLIVTVLLGYETLAYSDRGFNPITDFIRNTAGYYWQVSVPIALGVSFLFGQWFWDAEPEKA